VAFVESATQLINVAEWAHASGEAHRLRVDVLPPSDPFTVRQIERVAELVSPLGLDVRMLTVRGRTPRLGLDVPRAARDIAGASLLVVGDPFSRFIQTLLPLSRAADVVVVDDGTATWEFVTSLDAGKPLVRWDVPLESAEPRSRRATRFYSPSRQRRLTVFSCLNDAHPAGAENLANNYAWARSWRRPEVLEDHVDVLGVSLVGTGKVRRYDYVQAVSRLAARYGQVRYLPHRRESDRLVDEIAAIPGVRVQRGDLPVELALREGPVARHVITFPSTASHTLPVVLSDLGLHIEVRRIEQAWFTPQTTSHARHFVDRIAAAAPVPPALEAV